MHDQTPDTAPPPATVTRAESTVPRALQRYLSLDDFEISARRLRPNSSGYVAGAVETDVRSQTTAGHSPNTASCRGCSTTCRAASRPRRCSGTPTRPRSAFRRWARRAVRLPRRRGAGARRRGDERAADLQRVLADPARGRRRGNPTAWFQAYLAGDATRIDPLVDRVARRRLRHLRGHRRRAGRRPTARTTSATAFGPARLHPADRMGRPHPSALAVLHLPAHAAERTACRISRTWMRRAARRCSRRT